ncbi:CDP-alcohol phosphatidyltransferase family protein [Acidobacteriota bacterium]
MRILNREPDILRHEPLQDDWKNKPSDRFILRWIKRQISARITPRLVHIPWLRPWMLTFGAAFVGILAGAAFGIGWGFFGGLLAAAAQIFDGVDGQFARFTGRQSKAGAFLDSIMDRYSDGALVIGLSLYMTRFPELIALWQVIVLGALALIGSNLVSYTTARAESLGISLGRAPLVSKGTRTTVIALCGVGSLIWPLLPAIALAYLVIHSNGLVAYRLLKAGRSSSSEPEIMGVEEEYREPK